jgi:hypothetical protein
METLKTILNSNIFAWMMLFFIAILICIFISHSTEEYEKIKKYRQERTELCSKNGGKYFEKEDKCYKVEEVKL